MDQIINNISWHDILPRGEARLDGEDGRPLHCHNVINERAKAYRRELAELLKPQHRLARVGQELDVFGLATHFGCGVAEAIRQARRLGWPEVVRSVPTHDKNGKTRFKRRMLDVRIWTVQEACN